MAFLLRIEGLDFPLNVEPLSSERYTSPHTGREIRKVFRKAVIDERIHEIVKPALDGGVVTAVNPQGHESGRWKVKVPQYSVSGGRNSYHLELEEAEDLSSSRVLLGKDNSIVLEPYRYEDERLGDGIQIRLFTKLTPEQTEQLFDFRLSAGRGEEYFPVVREGISDQPKRMRFGRGRWSRHEVEGVNKHEVILIDDAADDSLPHVKRGLGDAFGDERARVEIAMAIEHRTGLMDLLEQKGVISKEERETLRDQAYERAERRFLDFLRTVDIDDERH